MNEKWTKNNEWRNKQTKTNFVFKWFDAHMHSAVISNGIFTICAIPDSHTLSTLPWRFMLCSHTYTSTFPSFSLFTSLFRDCLAQFCFWIFRILDKFQIVIVAISTNNGNQMNWFEKCDINDNSTIQFTVVASFRCSFVVSCSAAARAVFSCFIFCFCSRGANCL